MEIIYDKPFYLVYLNHNDTWLSRAYVSKEEAISGTKLDAGKQIGVNFNIIEVGNGIMRIVNVIRCRDMSEEDVNKETDYFKLKKIHEDIANNLKMEAGDNLYLRDYLKNSEKFLEVLSGETQRYIVEDRNITLRIKPAL